jgi:UDP-glucose 4-epimerase
MSRVLVLGGNGFIGSHIVDILHRNKFAVRVFDKEPDKFKRDTEGVDYVTGSFKDTLALAESLVGIDIVVHALSTSVPSTSNNAPIDDIEGNLIGTVNLLNLMLENKTRRIIFLSSGGTVYGMPQSIPISEDHPTNPICSYGIVKLAIEKYLFEYEQLHGFEPIIFRSSNLYGPRQGHIGVQGIIATLITKMFKKESVTIYGDGNLIRDYLYVDDLAELCLKAVRSKEKGIFNAGSGKGYSINDLVKIVSEISGEKLLIQKTSGRMFDVKENVLDVKKAETFLHWKPTTNIESGLRKYLEWLKTEID